MTVGTGWRVMGLLGRLSSPRGIAMDTQGHLLVSERNKGITGHVLDANGCVTSSKTVVQDNGPNHGIDVNPEGTKLFARYG
jgi:DNA-binding beta-propeller fold protein YncE